MGTTFYRLAIIGVRSRGGGLIATVKAWWISYTIRRTKRAAIIQLHRMSDRELQDIGLSRSQIERAVRGELDRSRSPAITDGSPAASESRSADRRMPTQPLRWRGRSRSCPTSTGTKPILIDRLLRAGTNEKW